ncbi:MAG: hypothetical protein PHE53_05155 [Thermoguttaceae bacterium]|nr:hypothetical protein [Thermoguttaceae bacterium]
MKRKSGTYVSVGVILLLSVVTFVGLTFQATAQGPMDGDTTAKSDTAKKTTAAKSAAKTDSAGDAAATAVDSTAQPEAAQSETAQPEAAAADGPLSYKEDAVKAGDRNEARKLLVSGALDATSRGKLDAYYKGYAFPRWTVVAQLGNIASWRGEYRTELKTVKSGAKYDLLMQYGLDFANRVTQTSGYHPATVFNAILMVGEMNESEEGASPKPLPKGLDFLAKVFQNDASTDAMRIASLIGLKRHAAAGISDANAKDAIQKKCLEIAQTAVEADAAADGKNWLRVQAIQMLAAMKDAGKKAETAVELAKVIDDPQATAEVRMAAVMAIGSLSYQGVQSDGLDVLRPVLRYYLESTNQIVQKVRSMDVSYAYTVDAWRTPLGQLGRGGMGMSGGMSGSDMMMGGGDMMSGPSGMSGGMGMGMGGRGSAAGGLGQPYGSEDRERAYQLRHKLLAVLMASKIGIAGPSRDSVGPITLLGRSPAEKAVFDQVITDINKQTELLNKGDDKIKEEAEEKVKDESLKNRKIMGAFDTIVSEINQINTNLRSQITGVSSLADTLEGRMEEETGPEPMLGPDGQPLPSDAQPGMMPPPGVQPGQPGTPPPGVQPGQPGTPPPPGGQPSQPAGPQNPPAPASSAGPMG